MGGVAKTTAVFAVIGSVFVAGSLIGRSALHLDCLGPWLPGWGCMADPYPQSLPLPQPVLLWAAVGAFGWLACYVIRDLAFKLLAVGIHLVFPGYLDQFDTRPPVPREYKLR
jgi:hypothetical protein